MNKETRQQLFSYMSNEHSLHLLESELDEIEHIINKGIDFDAMIEYAKAKCEQMRMACMRSYIHKEDIEKTPLPDFK